MYLLQLQQQHEGVRQHNILCGMKSGGIPPTSKRANKQDEDPRNAWKLYIKLTISECNSCIYQRTS